MAFECARCRGTIEDDSLSLPRAGKRCPHCGEDPAAGWSPYQPEVADAGRAAAEELDLRLLVRQDYGVREAALWFLEDTILEERHELSIRLGRNPGVEQRCSVCGETSPAGTGFRIELYDRWRATRIVIALCERHANEGLWGREFDLHANHPDPWLTRGDWHYEGTGKEQA